MANELAAHLDRLFRNHRTFDGKELTDGDVISAIGFLFGDHVKTPERLDIWLRDLQLAAVSALPKGTTDA